MTSRDERMSSLFAKKKSAIPSVPKTLCEADIQTYKMNAATSKDLKMVYGKVNRALAYQGAMVNGRHSISHIERATRDYKLDPRMYFKEEIVASPAISPLPSISLMSSASSEAENRHNSEAQLKLERKRQKLKILASTVKVHGIDSGKKAIGEGLPTIFGGLTECDSTVSSKSSNIHS